MNNHSFRPTPFCAAQEMAWVRLGIRVAFEGAGITIKGEWNNVWNAMFRCKEQIDWDGEPPISVTLKIDPDFVPPGETTPVVVDLNINRSPCERGAESVFRDRARPARFGRVLWRDRQPANSLTGTVLRRRFRKR